MTYFRTQTQWKEEKDVDCLMYIQEEDQNWKKTNRKKLLHNPRDVSKLFVMSTL